MSKVAVYFGTQNIYHRMEVSAKSLLYNTSVEKIYFIVEDIPYPNNLPNIIEPIKFEAPNWFNPAGPNYKGKWTYMGLVRSALTKIFPQTDIILSIDADAVVERDLSELWSFQLEPYYFAAVKEPSTSNRKGYDYVNSGVMLLNLKKMREDNKDLEMITALNTKYYFCTTQDVLNEYCQGKILLLPSEYNSCFYTGEVDKPKVIHCTGKYNWEESLYYKKYAILTWGAACKKNLENRENFNNSAIF